MTYGFGSVDSPSGRDSTPIQAAENAVLLLKGLADPTGQERQRRRPLPLPSTCLTIAAQYQALADALRVKAAADERGQTRI